MANRELERVENRRMDVLAKNNVRSMLTAQQKRRLVGGYREALKEQG